MAKLVEVTHLGQHEVNEHFEVLIFRYLRLQRFASIPGRIYISDDASELRVLQIFFQLFVFDIFHQKSLKLLFWDDVVDIFV